jgi:streptomycin 3"-adenylyltransferase
MTNDRAQSVPDADRDIQQFLIRLAAVAGETLDDRLTALYVHGSLANGSFRRATSDVDIVIVVSDILDVAERHRLGHAMVRLSDMRPFTGDLEVNVVSEEAARTFVHPMPYELHYSREFHEPFRRNTFDFAKNRTYRMLAAYIVDVTARGVTVIGPPPRDIFAPVPWHAFVDAQHADFDWQRDRAAAGTASVLSLCRVLHGATAREIVPLDRSEAAQWALQALPQEHLGLVRDALSVYRTIKTEDDVVVTPEALQSLRDYVYDRSAAAFDRAADDEDDDEDVDGT